MTSNATGELARREARIASDRKSARSSSGPVMAGGNEAFEMSEAVVATPGGGIALVHRLVRQVGSPELIDDFLSLLKLHLPYHESDHVLTMADNVVCRGKTLDDIERLREDEAFLHSLGTGRIPDATIA